MLSTAFVACRSSGQVQGAVQGHFLVAADAMALTGDQLTPGANGAGLYVISTPGLCAQYQSGASPSSATALVVELAQTDAQGNRLPPTPGDYGIIPQDGSSLPASARVAVATLVEDDDSCTNTVLEHSTSGTVHVSSFGSAQGGSIVGSLDLLFGGDHLSGTFDAPYCSGPFPAAGTCQAASAAAVGSSAAPVP